MITYKFVGGSNFVFGVPARDIPEEEWLTLEEELRKVALDRKIYVKVSSAVKKDKE